MRASLTSLILAWLLTGCSALAPRATSMPSPTRAPSTPQPQPSPSSTAPLPTEYALAATLEAQPAGGETQAAAMLPAFEGDVLTLPAATRYHIQLQVEFDPLRQRASMEGAVRIRFHNPLETPLADLVLMLWPNDDQYRSSMVAGSASLGDASIPPEELLGGLALRYELPEPLEPGASIDFSVPFQVEASGSIGRGTPGRFGISDGVLFAPTFYPLVPRLLDGAWEAVPAPRGGDTTNSEVSLYRVEISADQAFDLVATGVEVDRRSSLDARQTVTYVSGPTRDFAFALADFTGGTREVDGVEIRGWVLPEHASQLDLMLDAAAVQLGLFNQLIGPYPYRELDLVDVPGAYGGIEYPGLVSIGTLGGGNVIIPTVHEVAHQWFYGLVGDDQLVEPWLDEAAATYAEVLYFEHIGGSGSAAGLLADFREVLRSHPQPTRPIGGGVEDYPSGRDYGLFVYLKGALFFDALRAEMGDELFFAFLRGYFDEYRYRVATGADFQRSAEMTCGCDLEALFDLWVRQGGEIPGL